MRLLPHAVSRWFPSLRLRSHMSSQEVSFLILALEIACILLPIVLFRRIHSLLLCWYGASSILVMLRRLGYVDFAAFFCGEVGFLATSVERSTKTS